MKNFFQLAFVIVLVSLVLSSCSRRCGGWYNPKVEVKPVELCPDMQIVKQERSESAIEL